MSTKHNRSEFTRQPQIFGVGGNFFPPAYKSTALQRHLLSLAGVASPRICLLAAANGENPYDIEVFYHQMNKHDCRPYHLSTARMITLDYLDYFMSMDIIYVFGGVTKNLMAIWREWEMIDALREAWQAGVVLSGCSAGSICWFESCITDSFPTQMLPLKCTGFLKGSASTHYDARPDRPPTFRRLIASGEIESPGIATDDDTALHYIGDTLHEVVTARRGATAYRVERTPDGYSETALPARYIGDL